ncbi:MAG: hypothetical protein PUG21_07305 [Prevotella sp.]|nr:hypothetical protein [Prevotella sp.]
MKRLSTSLLIFILALLAMPERMWAENVYLLTGQTIKDTQGSYTNPPSQHKFTNTSGTEYTYTFSNAEASGDIYFRISVSGWENNMQPANNDDPLTINGDKYSITDKCYGKNKAWKLALDNTKYSSYTITVDISGNNRYVKVTGEASGTATTYNLVYLVDKALKNEGLHTWLEGGATDKGITDWNSRPTIGSGDFATTTTYNGTQYYTKTFSVDKTTADSYKQIGVKIGGNDGSQFISNVITSTWDNVQYIIVTSSGVNIVENTANMYTVTVSSADESMGTVSTPSVSVNATTSQPVTANAKSGYEFDYWAASEGVSVDDESSATTTVTATQPGTLIANFKEKSTPTPTPTPILGNNFYLVGDFLNTDDGINYACRYFKLSETAAATAARDGVEKYSINIPTTLAVNVQILATDEKGSTALYGPSGEVTINKNNPSGSGSTTGALVAASKTLTNYFKFEDRTTGRTTETPNENDGLYTITVTVTNGVPTNYTITHNPLTRVAYYLPNTSDASVKESLNSRSENTAAFNNVFFGRVYLPANVSCYVLSNYLGNYDSSLKTDTKKKLYLQGNRSGGNPDTKADGAEKDKYTKVYPIKTDNGTDTDAKPFVFSETDIVAMNLEYAPRRGNNTYQAENIYGEVIRSQKTTQTDDETVVTIPTIKVLKMVGPAVGDDTWNYNNGVVMNYNMAEQCWEATINTSAKAGAKFRFVANNTWENSWQENGTAEADKARIPYNVDGVGHAATPADPNEVSYISLTQDQVRDEKYDIIFNRDPGTWRVRFYFTSQQIDENNYKYVFKYTINGYKSVLRTYCSNRDEKPTDESIKIYGAYAFDGDPVNKSGKIKLYEMNYIPANEGVILYSANVIDEATIDAYTPSDGEKMYKNIPNADYKNYLVGTIDNTTVNASVFDGNERTHRNFFFNYFSKSGCYTDGATDYLGFFRIKSGSTCYANHAYLSLPTNILAWNGQTFGQVMDQYETTGEVASLKNGMRIIFSDGSDWVEDVPTSITTIKDKNRVFDNYYYTLQGVRVEKPLKGIYIHNGKKVVIK